MMEKDEYFECRKCGAIIELPTEDMKCPYCNEGTIYKCYELVGIPLSGNDIFKFDTELAKALVEFTNKNIVVRIIPR